MKKFYQTTMAVLAMLFMFGGLLLVAYIAWSVERKFHYKMSYEDMVRTTVREMVKTDALRPR